MKGDLKRVVRTRGNLKTGGWRSCKSGHL